MMIMKVTIRNKLVKLFNHLKEDEAKSLYIVLVSVFVSALGSTIIITGIWPYLKVLDDSIELEEYGYVVASDALAQMIFSPIFGYICDRLGSIRVVSLTCSVIFTLGHLFYSFVALIPKTFGGLVQARLYAIFVARFLVGMGTANIAPYRMYIAKTTTIEERAGKLGYLSLAQLLGFIVGPAIQSALSPIGEKPLGEGPISDDPTFHFDMYTACGYVGALTGIFSFVLFLPFLFKENYGIQEKCPTKELTNVENSVNYLRSCSNVLDMNFGETNNDATNATDVSVSSLETASSGFGSGDVKHENVSSPDQQKPNTLATICCMYVAFAVYLTYVYQETIASALVMDQFGWSREEAIRYLGIAMATGGITAGLIFTIAIPHTKRFDNRKTLILCGVIPFIISKLVILPMGNTYPPRIHNETNDDGVMEEEGCEYDWCLTVPQIHMAQFFIQYYISVIAFPFCTTLITAVFSCVLGDIPQGFWLGMLTLCGSLSRVVGPIAVSYIYEELGTYWAYGIIIIVLSLALIMILLSYSKLKPKYKNESNLQ